MLLEGNNTGSNEKQNKTFRTSTEGFCSTSSYFKLVIAGIGQRGEERTHTVTSGHLQNKGGTTYAPHHAEISTDLPT